MSKFAISFAIVLLIYVCAAGNLSGAPRPEGLKASTDTSPVPVSASGFLEKLLLQNPGKFKHILEHPDSFYVQIIYTEINRDKTNRPVFKDHYFNSDKSTYFYPASTVKMPVALLALQKLQELKIKGLDRNSPMITETAHSGQTPAYNDPSTPSGNPSIAHYIKKIFLVSDNDAFNRLYEFLGPPYINSEMQRKGYKETEIIHRLSISLSEDENRHTNPVYFLDHKGHKLYSQPGKYNERSYSKRKDQIGIGYMKGDTLVGQPLDFSKKNRIRLTSLHNTLRSVMFPLSVPSAQRFHIAPDDYKFVRKYMSQKPADSGFPPYDPSTYYETYCKFLLFGSEPDAKIPPHIRIYNKVGNAYGFLLDVAYIADFKNKVEFMLSAVIYCNRDGILNDDAYDYEEYGYPFMKHIGEVIYKHELNRKRTFRPDLSAFLDE